ncbi:MAG: hypothetical protein JW395_0059 [Nitrospira sp.]|nr:hypothetical protein [Nitrospira sp.]
MTDGISGSGPVGPRFTSPVKTQAQDAKKNASAAVAGGDSLEVGPTAQMLNAEPGFDADKVASIRQAIARGNYPLDANKIAESFVALERMFNSDASLGSGPAD